MIDRSFTLGVLAGAFAASSLLFAGEAAAPTTTDAPAGGPPQVTLREVIEGNLLGIQREPEELHVRVRNSARTYAAWKRGVLTPDEFEKWKTACTAKPESDEFCPLIMGKDPSEFVDAEEEVKEEPGTDIPLSSTAKEAIAAWKAADFSALKKTGPGPIYRSLRTFKDWAPLEPAAKKILSESKSANCDNPAVATALGQKAEMFLPDRKFRDIAFSLYEKVVDCQVTEHSSRAKFRYALLKIEDGDCKTADPLMEKLYGQNDLEYLARSLYWRERCAQMRGDKLRAAMFKQRLLKESPLSYHSIISNREEIAKLTRVVGTSEPTIRYRSLVQPKLNQWVRAIEGLVAVGADEIARRVIAKTVDVIQKTEPEVRLYVGSLALRVGDPISQFRLLSTVFRDEPRLISQTTLKLFYPMKNFSTIRKYSGETDPYFVAALIRQESGFNPWARSRVGAMGLMQLMPSTARRIERTSKRSLMLPETNIRIGTKYIGRLVNRYDRDAELALAAYNAGPERVDDWTKRYPTADRMLFLDLIPYKETRDYVALIGRNFYWYHTLYGNAPIAQMHPGGKGLGRMPAAEGAEERRKPLFFTLYR
ncbi:MAG: lytic transglycosylase domain-containing protein [Bdellovibrionales bacterium]|nr:lytic transglycosylase domain-containing protein [Bdellovibrionales bacterium]